MKEHLYYIDLLKSIGIIFIVIAHVGAPLWMNDIRAFDVPLMVIISSCLASLTYKENHSVFSLKYIWKRFQRLVIPTWFFLLFYFLLRFISSKELFPLQYYFYSFALTRYGISYVWVILIYLYCAFLTPIFAKHDFNRKSILLVLDIYMLYELIVYLGIGSDLKIIETTIYYIIPYGVLAFFGFNYFTMSKKERWFIACISFVLFVISAVCLRVVTDEFQHINTAKYPPRLYYISYGLSLSFILLIVSERIPINGIIRIAASYISKHSLWIYLWHILVIGIYDVLGLPDIWWLRFIVVFVVSIGIVIVVNYILDIIEKRTKKLWVLKYLRG